MFSANMAHGLVLFSQKLSCMVYVSDLMMKKDMLMIKIFYIHPEFNKPVAASLRGEEHFLLPENCNTRGAVCLHTGRIVRLDNTFEVFERLLEHVYQHLQELIKRREMIENLTKDLSRGL